MRNPVALDHFLLSNCDLVPGNPFHASCSVKTASFGRWPSRVFSHAWNAEALNRLLSILQNYSGERQHGIVGWGQGWENMKKMNRASG